MASDDDLKKLMDKTKSIASVSFVERQLKKKIEERCSVAEGEDQVRELNKQQEGHPSPEPQKPVSEAGSDPTSSEDEKEEKRMKERRRKRRKRKALAMEKAAAAMRRRRKSLRKPQKS